MCSGGDGMDIAQALALLGGMGTICGILVAIFNYKKANKVDNKDEGKQEGLIFSELGFIKSGIEDIKRKQDKQDEQHLEVVQRLSAVEQSAKQAHHRIDKLEEGAKSND